MKCFIALDPARLPARVLYEASSILGAARHGRALDPREAPKVDLVIAGSVAVNRRGERIGKGGGYSDLEWALGRELGFVGRSTLVATTVHPAQIVPDRLPVLPHDLALDLIATPDDVIEVRPRPPNRAGSTAP